MANPAAFSQARPPRVKLKNTELYGVAASSLRSQSPQHNGLGSSGCCRRVTLPSIAVASIGVP